MLPKKEQANAQIGTQHPLFSPVIWLKRQFQRLGVRQKLSYGFCIVAGVALVIVLTGRTIEGTYREQAVARLVQAHTTEEIISNLGAELLQVQIQQQKLLLLVREPQGWNQASIRLQQSLQRINALLSDTNSWLKTVARADKNNSNTQSYQQLQQLILTYEQTAVAYSQQLEELLAQLDNLSSSPSPTGEKLRQSVIDFNQSQTAIKFGQLAQDLTVVAKLSHQDKAIAFAQVQSVAVFLETEIFIATVLVTLVIAYLFGRYTSRAIALPLEAVTQVAQQVTKDSNFTLKAPVTTTDEVGVLATSLNALIKRVAEYTCELELARQTLEQRVAERTQQLTQKNQQLEQTHDQLTKAIQHLQQAQAQLIHTEKMSSIGQMLAGIAHEINNPISFIYGNILHAENYVQDLLNLVNLYQQVYPQPEAKIQEQIQAIELDFLSEDLLKLMRCIYVSADRICQLVISLRNFSRLDEAPVKNVNLHEGLDSTLIIINTRIKTGIKVCKQYGDLPPIECYPSQLNQVFMNILTNSIDALLEDQDNQDKQIGIQTNFIAPNTVQVKFKDNGPGIPGDIQVNMFDPFFTTKPVGQGTGLGLSICAQIMEKHNGRIIVCSQVGEGTEFILTLPTKQT